ncbi:GTP-binding protein [Arthrobacter sp. M4]|uniref:GTP-binding protein n=1 Tax=Arthrobacter sp. M4 TaxID=218160 RepID=UPI001CDC9966|nr:GTP-binding protein [Arthrobacter sp. M4]MCA4133425.1 GTP-binding protein [Arthrobacter sp. M4]
MPIIVVSSLDPLGRGPACEAIAAARPGTAVVVHDLQEHGVVLRRLYRGGELYERSETVLQHDCLSCTVRLDVVPAVAHLLDQGVSEIVVGLPGGVPAAAAVQGLRQGIGPEVPIASAVLACDPAAVEDQLWDRHTLFESGFTAHPEDERTPGEFLIEELAYCDTVLLSGPGLLPAAPGLRRRGTELLQEIAPHAAINTLEGDFRPGRHDFGEAVLRSVPGAVRVPANGLGSHFRTVLHRVGRPLHPGRLQEALPRLAAGNCWLRGRLWVASAPDCRIAVRGVGPRVWLENTGPWAANYDDGTRLDGDGFGGLAGTVLAVTGDEVDGEEIAQLLSNCQLTDAEMASDSRAEDPFDLSTL